MKQLRSLVAMQLRDKVELGFLKDKKQLFRTLLFSLIKFLIVTVVVIGVLFISKQFIFKETDVPKVMILVLGVLFILTLLGCTFELMKNLYYSEDNRVLITLPVEANKIFISKIIVFFFYELKKSISFTFPFILGCSIFMSFFFSYRSPVYLSFWMIIPTFLIVLFIVLLSAILSIGVMFVYRFLKKYSVVEIVLFISVLVASIIGIVYLIKLIPTDIDLINQWDKISNTIHEGLIVLENKVHLLSEALYTIFGEYNPNTLRYEINLTSWIKLIILAVLNVILYFLAYYLSRPIFFKMMAKNFEINKSKADEKPNKQRNKYFTFINKEFLINLRTINISVNYLFVYIAIPILILFLNVMYKAMDTREFGKMLIYTFNVLLIMLPLLASNALVATYYSREGRAAYIKKTKPIFAIYPLFAKLFFNVICSIPTIFITVGIFGSYCHFKVLEIFFLGLAILFVHLGHMIYSAELDVMNPQNEQYATVGTQIENPNENKSTVFAFIISFVFAIVAFKLFSEASLSRNLMIGIVKLMLLGLAYFGSMLMLFVKRVKAFYYSI